jgi:hypothetical protein
MFRSLLYDHPQGPSFVLGALPLLCLFCFVQLLIQYVAVCCLQCNVCIRKMIPWFYLPRYEGSECKHYIADNIQPHTE